jgi:hypothetical protein
MSIEEIIRTWKAGEEALEPGLPESPVGRELDEQELLEVDGGSIYPMCGPDTCFFTYCGFDTAIIW